MIIGKAKFKNYSKFDSWLRSEGMHWGYENKYQFVGEGQTYNKDMDEALSSLYLKKGGFTVFPYDNSRNADKFHQIYEYTAEYGLSFELVESNDVYSIFQFGKQKYLVPTGELDIEIQDDMSHLTLGEIRGLGIQGAGMQLARLEESITIAGTEIQVEKKQQEIETIQRDIKKLKEEQQQELERIKAELEARYKEKAALIQEKMQKAQQQLESIKQELFLLDTELYGIRCFLGETVEFIKLRSGRPAAVEEPVVLYQKIRFLDEELAKMVSIYALEETDISLFEKFIQSCDFAAEHFAPGDKSISLVQLTRESTGYVSSSKLHNMLEKYDVYHGHRIGVLIRNGMNLYIGWTDAERIQIPDENLFYRPKKEEYQQEEKENHLKKLTKEEVASRYFVYSILQGALHGGDMLQIPKEESIVNGGGKYIIYSMADGYLEDNRFGLFRDILERCNQEIRKDDAVLCVQQLRAKQSNYTIYSNDRGRGEKNRTHDVSASDNTIYYINLLEVEEYPRTTYMAHGNEYHTRGWAKEHTFSNDVKNIREEIVKEPHYFVSLHKSYSASERARANFELFSDEIINLTFLNSVWLLYAINNRKVGRWHIGGQEVSFAYSLKYLNKALEYIKEREEKERELLLIYMGKLPAEWQVALSEWKLSKHVHFITDYQAKRFAKYYQSEKKD